MAAFSRKRECVFFIERFMEERVKIQKLHDEATDPEKKVFYARRLWVIAGVLDYDFQLKDLLEKRKRAEAGDKSLSHYNYRSFTLRRDIEKIKMDKLSGKLPGIFAKPVSRPNSQRNSP